MKDDPAHNWKAADGGKRQLGKHAGYQTPYLERRPLPATSADIIGMTNDQLDAHCAIYADMLAALKEAEQELEANKTAMLGPEWAAQRTATGGALLTVSRAIMKAEGRI
jgi:hypothetical protein